MSEIFMSPTPAPRLRLLLVEDDKGRADRIRSWLPGDVLVTHCASAGRAIGTLRRDRGSVYAGVLLDHDLQGATASAMDEALSGADVATEIVRCIDSDVPILVHSMNPQGARTMCGKLESAGFDVTRIAMVALDREKLNAWLAEVRARWQERLEE